MGITLKPPVMRLMARNQVFPYLGPMLCFEPKWGIYVKCYVNCNYKNVTFG